MQTAPRKARERAPAESDELNLVPIMNLVVCLIPVILLGTSLIQLGTIDVEAPRICASCHTTFDGPPLGLTITITADGFELRASDRVALNTALIDRLDPTLADPEFVPIPRAAGRLDFAALYTALVQVKSERPDAVSVNVNAAPGTRWQEVVSTLDVARNRLTEDRYDDADALASASPRRGPPAESALFPSASLMAVAR